MSVTDELLENARDYAERFDKGDLPLPPGRKVAVLACMDARLNPYGLLGLAEGDAHVIRNAGGVVTDDEIRSLAISQRLLGTEEIVLIHHTDCGMLTFTNDHLRAKLRQETGEDASHIDFLFTMFTTPGFTDERIHVFLASGLERGSTAHEADEFMTVETMTLSRALELIQEGRINDAKTALAILYAAGFRAGR